MFLHYVRIFLRHFDLLGIRHNGIVLLVNHIIFVNKRKCVCLARAHVQSQIFNVQWFYRLYILVSKISSLYGFLYERNRLLPNSNKTNHGRISECCAVYYSRIIYTNEHTEQLTTQYLHYKKIHIEFAPRIFFLLHCDYYSTGNKTMMYAVWPLRYVRERNEMRVSLAVLRPPGKHSSARVQWHQV